MWGLIMQPNDNNSHPVKPKPVGCLNGNRFQRNWYWKCPISMYSVTYITWLKQKGGYRRYSYVCSWVVRRFPPSITLWLPIQPHTKSQIPPKGTSRGHICMCIVSLSLSLWLQQFCPTLHQTDYPVCPPMHVELSATCYYSGKKIKPLNNMN